MSIIGRILRFFVERGAKGQSYEDLRSRLERGEASVVRRLEGAGDTPRNREIVAHVTGIERWGQRRLRSLLGEPLLQDDYDGYRPSTAQSLAALRDEFQATRQETLALLGALGAAAIEPSRTVPHNDAGEMSVGGWLVYLNSHAGMEAKRVR